MYGVSKINIETDLMMISVQDVVFRGNSLSRYLDIFAETGVVVDMISQSAPHGTSDLDISLLVHAENEDAAYEALKKAYEL